MFDERRVSGLAARRGDPVMTSFYLDVDGRRYPRPTDYHPHVMHLCHTARSHAALLGGAAEAAVDADLARICGWLDDGIDRTATRGIAVFCCAGQDYFETLLSPVPLRDEVSIARTPIVSQLLEILEHHARTLVVLIDRQEARLVRVELGVVTERPGVLDGPERRADTGVELGGWEHRREEAARRHFRRTAATALEEVRAWRPDQLILGGPADDVAGLAACLDRAVSDLLIGTVALPIHSSTGAVAGAVIEIIRDLELRRERGLVEALRERAAQGRQAAIGLPAVMTAVSRRRVDTLIVARGFHVVGARCPACGHVGVAACQCPECGTPSLEVDDVVEFAINEALAQHAEVVFCDGTDLEFSGGVGALKRF